MADKFDQTCDCAVVHMTPADTQRFERIAPAHVDGHFAQFMRDVINNGGRPVSFAVNCPHCHGTGIKPVRAA